MSFNFPNDGSAFHAKIQKLSKINPQTKIYLPSKRPHDGLRLRNTGTESNSSTTTSIDENAKSFLNGISGTIEYSLADILTHISDKLENSELFQFKSIWGHDPVTFYFPKGFQWRTLFDKSTFLKTFEKAFGQAFPTANMFNTDFAGFDVKISTAGLGNSESSITFEQAHYFRTMFCLIMGTVMKIKFNCCACFPKTFLQWTAWQAGIKMNCISQDCSSWLESHSETYDSLFVGDCSQTLTQLALVEIQSMTATDIITNINLKISTTLNTIEKIVENV